MDKQTEGSAMVGRRSQSVYDNKRGIIMGYLAPGEDLLTGLKKVCQEHQVIAGTINCIGSLSHVSIIQLDYEDDHIFYTNPTHWDTPVELLSGHGVLGKKENGELDIHFHGVFVDHRKTINGGHFLEGTNTVAITIEYTIYVTDEIQPVRKFDESTGFTLFNFYNKSDVQ
ncbi:PPC domain-containing DNA-binding protein [Cytobacillus kochii]|uniref:PPC domain-containing DNA-binding protein n=1 Tax=Cytobacillus kochii TaxID=859143 RepID=UPI00203CE28D|nr:PPC domain-containing DNA-binding protein [Cytobacillus kochii]MCM3323565.1 DNA-binding protein [Cytobacillus kochii]MCM3345960.1 DNA-binding protein [Cytobacillus kochii]